MPSISPLLFRRLRAMLVMTPALLLLLSICVLPLETDAIAGDRLDEVEPDWTSIPWDPYPLLPGVPSNPVLTKNDVTDVIGVQFVADPFVLYAEGAWYMFFEAWAAYGKIGLAVSYDGLNWVYHQVVLDTGYHLSFPVVFYHNGDWYLLPESSEEDKVQLFRATSFPYNWEEDAIILSGDAYVDPSIFWFDNTWWMFAGTSGSNDCRLFYSDTLKSGWTEHPMSPIVQGNNSKARPAGRTLVLEDGRIIRLAQKSDVTYGEAVRAFDVDFLTRSVYSETEIPESPILEASGSGWNSGGMHHCDPFWITDRWIAAVDGWSPELSWSIGIYQTIPLQSVEHPFGSDPSRIQVSRSYPNPFASSTQISYMIPGESADNSVSLSIHDFTGRRIRTLVSGRIHPGIHSVVWDGTDSRGEQAPSGTYFYKLDLNGKSTSERVTLVR